MHRYPIQLPAISSVRFSFGYLALILCAGLCLSLRSSAHAENSIEAVDFHPWEFSSDPVATLWKKIHQGEVKLDSSSEKAFLLDLLKHLDIPVASQVLVFSKTSLQNNLIHPKTPRAIYFNETTYIGWVQGGMLEAITYDPNDGTPQFYVIERSLSSPEQPGIGVSEQCFSCHETTRTENVKGPFVRSVFASKTGQPLLRHGSYITTHASPLKERWGGWYVTGQHGMDLHMGNVIATESADGQTVQLPREQGANLTTLEGLFDLKPYPAVTSDIVALMILEHQCAVQNLLTAAAKATHEAMERQRSIQDAFGETISDEPQGSALNVIQHHAEKIVKALLFTDEYPLQSPGVEGSSEFQEAFRRNRIENPQGRSLKDFQLRTRLFKYRCSYMIHAPTFKALPLPLKKQIHLQLQQAIAPEPSKLGEHLSESERENLRTLVPDVTTTDANPS